MRPDRSASTGTSRCDAAQGDLRRDGSRLTVGVVVAATAVAAALRLPFLTHQSIWLDEAFTRSIVGAPTIEAVWHQIEATESTPPLYYVLTWLLGGRSAAALRLIPALSLIAAVPASYLALRRLVGARSAAAAAVLVAVAPELVSYATDGRAYGLFVLTTVLTVWGFAVTLDDPSAGRFAAWALACIACIWTHYFGVFFVGAEAVVLLVLRPAARRTTVAATAAIVVGAAPLLPLLSAQSDNRAFFIATTSLASRLTHTAREFAMGPNVPRTWLEAAGLAIIAVATAAGAIRAIRGREEGPRAVVAIVAIAVGLPAALSLLGVRDVYDTRNVLPALPLVMALAAPELLRARGIPLLAYATLAIIAGLWVATNWRYENLDYRGAIARVRAIDATAPVVVETSVNEPVAALYLGRPPAAIPLAARTVWVVVEPDRGAGQRALHPGPEPAPPPGFSIRRELIVHAFRATLFEAPRPTPVRPATGVVFSGP